jgi:hypothetical protein
MADSTITALTAHTAPIPTDVVPIVDITAGATKKIALSSFVSGTEVKARAYLSSAQADLVNTSATLVNLDAESYDIGSDFNTTTHLFTAPVTGYYDVKAQVHLSSVVVNKEYHLFIKRDSTDVLHNWNNSPATLVNLIFSMRIEDTIYCTAGQTLGLWVQSDSGGNTVDLYGTDPKFNYMSVHLLSV